MILRGVAGLRGVLNRYSPQKSDIHPAAIRTGNNVHQWPLYCEVNNFYQTNAFNINQHSY